MGWVLQYLCTCNPAASLLTKAWAHAPNQCLGSWLSGVLAVVLERELCDFGAQPLVCCYCHGAVSSISTNEVLGMASYPAGAFVRRHQQ